MTMKLSICLLLAVVATASADQGFYQQSQPVAQSAPSGYNNYYDQQYQPVQKQGYVDVHQKIKSTWKEAAIFFAILDAQLGAFILALDGAVRGYAIILFWKCIEIILWS